MILAASPPPVTVVTGKMCGVDEGVNSWSPDRNFSARATRSREATGPGRSRLSWYLRIGIGSAGRRCLAR